MKHVIAAFFAGFLSRFTISWADSFSATLFQAVMGGLAAATLVIIGSKATFHVKQSSEEKNMAHTLSLTFTEGGNAVAGPFDVAIGGSIGQAIGLAEAVAAEAGVPTSLQLAISLDVKVLSGDKQIYQFDPGVLQAVANLS